MSVRILSGPGAFSRLAVWISYVSAPMKVEGSKKWWAGRGTVPGFWKVFIKVVNADGQSKSVASGFVRSMARSLPEQGLSHSISSPIDVLMRRTLRRKRRLIERTRALDSRLLWASLSLRREERLEASQSRSRVQSGRNRPGQGRELAAYERRVKAANRRAAASSYKGVAVEVRAAEASGMVRS